MADGGGGSEGAGLAEPGRRAGSAGFTAGRDACRYKGDAGTAVADRRDRGADTGSCEISFLAFAALHLDSAGFYL